MNNASPTVACRVDAHQHFWRMADGHCRWLSPELAELAPLWRDFEPAELMPLLAAHGVQQTVLVQAADNEAETDFLLSLADQHLFIAGVVGWVDLSRPASIPTLQHWAAHPRFKGVRPMLQDLPEADWIAHAPHPEVMQCLLRLGLRFDALVKPPHLPHLLKFLRAWPDLPAVIDHAAKPQLALGWGQPWAAEWRSGLAALAALPQVSCKLSGLLTEAAGPARQQPEAGLAALRPVWRWLLQHFGPHRLIWGSDWPVLNLAADYAGWVQISETLLQDLSAAERAAVWGGNAQRFYGLAAVGTPGH